MFGWGEKGNKVFWFEETKSGNQKLVRPDGTHCICRKKHPYFAELGAQALDGWQRAMLFMEEYGIWDATGFGCTMRTVLGIGTDVYEDERQIAYLFATSQCAETDVYPFLPDNDVQKCRENVERFYADVNLQAAWNSLILYPVCLKVREGKTKFEPMFIGDIGDGDIVLAHYEFTPISSIGDQECIQSIFNNVR